MVLTAPDGNLLSVSESFDMTHMLAEVASGLLPALDNFFGRTVYHRMLAFAGSELDSTVTAVYENVYMHGRKYKEQ